MFKIVCFTNVSPKIYLENILLRVQSKGRTESKANLIQNKPQLFLYLLLC